jgi:hypothetical protein
MEEAAKRSEDNIADEDNLLLVQEEGDVVVSMEHDEDDVKTPTGVVVTRIV